MGALIERGQIRQLLMQACPSFAASESLRDFDDEVGADDMEYLLAAAFVRHLVRLHVHDHHEEFDAVFDLVERLHLEGDKYVRDLASVGFLEDLGNTNLHHDGSAPRDFERYLRPESRWWWEELDLLWSGKIPYLGSSGRPRPHASG